MTQTTTISNAYAEFITGKTIVAEWSGKREVVKQIKERKFKTFQGMSSVYDDRVTFFIFDNINDALNFAQFKTNATTSTI